MHTIGILGAAGIAPNAIIAPVRRRSDVTVKAVASRREGAGVAYAAQHGIPTHYATYEAMLDDPEIDIVYNALPPVAHAEWTIKALQAGKHGLCEKPVVMNAGEATTMVNEAKRRGRVFAEAFHDRYHPVFLHLLSLKPQLGVIHALKAEFSVNIPYDPKNIRYDPSVGGGALMDLGCYPLHWLRCFMGDEPEIVSASARLCALGSDTRIEAQLRFNAVPATMIADIQDPPSRSSFRIEGELGVIELDNPCLPHRGHSLRVSICGQYREYTIAGGTTYDYQLAAFLEAIDTGATLPTGGQDSIGNMIALDRIYEIAGVVRPG
ncbi:Gfo/Idh/MocA family oxidoreductase [Agrobacterium tumefaciens]|uniref:Gfo/Idh/MocA family protein n=1 Tax=Agrobacterium tumefaciens TaxID=358 RepID=UPI00157477F6|nr:Gfo/Idh/MocA family oxidoreductase [Agrobacterium tumefaciens]NTA83809.1 Gfo/Idh/MocA family oxidoreductase [Agrobacterium tumefaciens]